MKPQTHCTMQWLVTNAPPSKKKKNSQEDLQGRGSESQAHSAAGLHCAHAHTEPLDATATKLKVVKGAPERKLASAKNHPPQRTC